MKCVPPLDHVDEALKCVDLQKASAGSAEKSLDVEKDEKNRDAVTANERFGLGSLQNTLSTVHVVRAITAVRPYTRELPWSSQRLYNSWFSESLR